MYDVPLMRRYQIPKPPPCKRPSFPKDHTDILFTTSTSHPQSFHKRNHPYSTQSSTLPQSSQSSHNSNASNSSSIHPSNIISISEYPNIACLLDPNVELSNLNCQDIESIIGGRHSGESCTTPVHKVSTNVSTSANVTPIGDLMTSMEIVSSGENTMDMIKEEDMEHATMVMLTDNIASPSIANTALSVNDTLFYTQPFQSQQSNTSSSTFRTGTSDEDEAQNNLKRSCSLPANAVLPTLNNQILQQQSIDSCSLSSYASSPPGYGGAVSTTGSFEVPSLESASATGNYVLYCLPQSKSGAGGGRTCYGSDNVTHHGVAGGGNVLMPSSNLNARDYLGLETLTSHHGTNAPMPPSSSNRAVGALLLHTAPQHYRLPSSGAGGLTSNSTHNSILMPPVRVTVGPPQTISQLPPSSASTTQRRPRGMNTIHTRRPRSETDYREDLLSLFPSCLSANELEMEESPARTQVEYEEDWEYDSLSEAASFSGSCDGMRSRTSVKSFTAGCYNGASSSAQPQAPVLFFSSASSSIHCPRTVSGGSAVNTNSNLYRCARRNCNASFATRAERDLHLREVHPTTTYKCTLCKKTFPSESKLQSHSISHLPFSERNALMCPFPNCGKRYFSVERYEKHINEYHEVNQALPHRASSIDGGGCGPGVSVSARSGMSNDIATYSIVSSNGFTHSLGGGVGGGYFDVRQMSCENLACTPVASHVEDYSNQQQDLYDIRIPTLSSGRSNMSCHVIGLSTAESNNLSNQSAMNGNLSSSTRRMSQPLSLNLYNQRGGNHSSSNVPAGSSGSQFQSNIILDTMLDGTNTVEISYPAAFINSSNGIGTGASMCGSGSTLSSANLLQNTNLATLNATLPPGSSAGNSICCRLCGIGPLSSADELQRHLLSHSREESTGQFSCPVEGCSQQFQRRLELSVHLNTHFPLVQQLFVYCCPIEGCDTVCADMQSFRTHFAKHVTAEIPGDINSVIPLDLPTPQSDENCVAMLGDLPSMDNDMELIRASSSLFQALDLMQDFSGPSVGNGNGNTTGNISYECHNTTFHTDPTDGSQDMFSALSSSSEIPSGPNSLAISPFFDNLNRIETTSGSSGFDTGGSSSILSSSINNASNYSTPPRAHTTIRQRPKSTTVDGPLKVITSTTSDQFSVNQGGSYQRYSCGQLAVATSTSTDRSMSSQPQFTSTNAAFAINATTKRKLTELRPKDSTYIKGTCDQSAMSMDRPTSSHVVLDDLHLLP